MTGRVDDYGRALVRLSVRHPQSGARAEWDAWIDTAFTGHVLLLPEQAAALNLTSEGVVPGAVASGDRASFDVYPCLVEWFGRDLGIQAYSSPGRFALVGIGLLEDLQITIDYPARTVRLVRSPSAGP
jgi:predicted aspartyl protease